VAGAQVVIGTAGSQTTSSSDDTTDAEQFFDLSGELLILEPVVQGFNLDDYAYVSQSGGKAYIPLSQMSSYLGIKFERNNGEIVLWYADDENVKYKIDFNGKRVFEINGKGDVIGEGLAVIGNYAPDVQENNNTIIYNKKTAQTEACAVTINRYFCVS
jgi:hypothetical protein